LLVAAGGRFLRAFLFGVAPWDPPAIAGAIIVLLSVATLASWIPARRASRVDPAEALRAE
jgi:ABC-type lipoprotein release transport system permease subunit